MDLRERHLKRAANDRREGLDGLLDAQRAAKEARGMEKLETRLWVAKMPKMSTSELIDRYAMTRFELEVIFRTGWQSFKDEAHDKAKADWGFGLGYSRVYVQIKGATLDKNGQWGPHIYRKGKSLDLGFYEGESSYLGLVLFHYTHKTFKLLWELGQLGPMEINATVLMLNGDRVIKYFEPHDPKTHSGMMRFSKKKYEEGGYAWLKGAKDLEGIFGAEAEWQERERRQRMERRRKEKEEREQ